MKINDQLTNNMYKFGLITCLVHMSSSVFLRVFVVNYLINILSDTHRRSNWCKWIRSMYMSEFVIVFLYKCQMNKTLPYKIQQIGARRASQNLPRRRPAS